MWAFAISGYCAAYLAKIDIAWKTNGLRDLGIDTLRELEYVG